MAERLQALAMKLSQVLYSQGFGARRQVEGLILAEHVALDGIVCADPWHEVEPEGLVFSVRGEAWPYHAKALLLLHKPSFGTKRRRSELLHVFASLKLAIWETGLLWEASVRDAR